MSGGFFDYAQYRIDDIADKMMDVCLKDHEPKEAEDYSHWDYDENGKLRDDAPRFEYEFSQTTHNSFIRGIKILMEAAVFAQRMDWLISGDDSEETYLNRLSEDLDEMEIKFKAFLWKDEQRQEQRRKPNSNT